MIVLTVIAVMMAAALAHHLGLADAVAKVVAKVAACLSNWFVLALFFLQRKFTQLYEKERKSEGDNDARK